MGLGPVVGGGDPWPRPEDVNKPAQENGTQTQTVYQAIRIALSYTPIDPEQLHDGCLSEFQCADAAQRVLTHFHANGWVVGKKVPDGWD